MKFEGGKFRCRADVVSIKEGEGGGGGTRLTIGGGGNRLVRGDCDGELCGGGGGGKFYAGGEERDGIWKKGLRRAVGEGCGSEIF